MTNPEEPLGPRDDAPAPKQGGRVAGLLRRVRAPALNLALVLFSFGVAGLFAEVAIRIVAPQQLIQIRPDLWQPADTFGWINRPDVDTEINTGERTVSVFTDQDGFRVGMSGRVEAGREVLIIGDSFMAALQVEYEQSAAGLLQESLPDLVGEPVAVRNAGVDGWDPDQYLLRVRSLLDRHRYDLLIVSVYMRNDIIPGRREYLPPRPRDQRYRLRFPRSLSFSELTDAVLHPINDFLETRSHLYVFVRNRMQTLRMQMGLSPLSFPPQFLRSQADADRWTITADILADIERLAGRRDVPTLFVFVPAPLQVDSALLAQNIRGFHLDPTAIDVDQPNRLLGAATAERGLTVYDPLPAFRAAEEAGEQLYGKVDPHFSPEGNRLFASLVAPIAAEMLKGARATGAGDPASRP